MTPALLRPSTIIRAYDLLLEVTPPPWEPRAIGSLRVYVSLNKRAALEAARRGRWDPGTERDRLARVLQAVMRDRLARRRLGVIVGDSRGAHLGLGALWRWGVAAPARA